MKTLHPYAIIAAILLPWPATSSTDGIIDTDFPAVSYVSFQSPNLLSPAESLTVPGQLRIPNSDVPNGVPAVVVLHGSAGIDSRGSFYIEALNDAGFATLEIDMWSARGLAGETERPSLPTVTVPDAFSALKFLAEHPAIDEDAIGLLGFSWGGVVTLLSTNPEYIEQYGNGRQFAAHVANYPVCWGYTAGIPGIFFDPVNDSDVLIQIGDRDDYDNSSLPCEALAAPFANVSVNVYKHAYHAWDRLEPAVTIFDPFAHQGVGGEVVIVANHVEALRSRDAVITFFQQKLTNGE